MYLEITDSGTNFFGDMFEYEVKMSTIRIFEEALPRSIIKQLLSQRDWLVILSNS